MCYYLFFPKNKKKRNFIWFIKINELETYSIFPLEKFLNKKIFLLLPHTPIKGIGFDFVFEFLSSTTSSFAKNILNKSNLNGEFTLSRNYYQKKEKDYILTIIGSINNDDPDILGIIEFNYNYKSLNYLKGDNVFCNQYNISTRLING